MPNSALTHRNNKAVNNHSLYHTNLLVDSTSILNDIKTNTASLNINTDALEGLHATTHTKLNGGLPSALTGSGNLKVCLQELGNEGSERLNVDVGGTVSQLPSALTGEGNLKVSIQEDFTHNLATSAHQLTTHGKLDDIASKAGSIKTAVELIDNAISGNEMQVDVVAALPAGTNKIGAVALKANEAVDGSGTERHLVTDANGFLQVEDKALTILAPTIQQSESTILQRVNLSLHDVSNSTTRTAKCDANGFLQVEDKTLTIVAPTVNLAESTSLQRVNLALHDSGNSTTRTAKCNASGELLVNAAGTVTANLSATDNAVLDDIASKAGSIKTAVELIDNAISGTEMQVDVVAALPAGTNKIGAVALKANEAADGSGTERHLVTDANGFLQVEDKTLTIVAPTVNLAESTSLQRVNLALHDSGNSTTRTAKCNASGELLVNAAGTVTANLSAVDNAVLDDIASKAGSIKTAVEIIDDIVKTEDLAHSSGDKGVMFLGVRQSVQADFGADGDYVPLSINDTGQLRVYSPLNGRATSAKQDVIEATLTNLETSLAALDNSVDGNYLNVNANIAGTDVDSNSGNKSAATQRVVVATDDVNLSAIKTAIEALNTRDSLTTTLIIDGQTVSAGGGTHTTSSFEVTNIPPDGKLKFLVRIAGVSVGEAVSSILVSADDTNFFGVDLSFIGGGNATSGVGQMVTCSFIPKHFKYVITNSNLGSAATVTVHMFN